MYFNFVNWLNFLLILLIQTESLSTYSLYKVDSVPFSSLLFNKQIIEGDATAANNIARSLIYDGIVQISEIPGFSSARKRALAEFSSCMSLEDKTTIRQMTMDDGTIRLTAAASSIQGKLGVMSNSRCSSTSSDLRFLIDSTMSTLFRYLDSEASLLTNSEDNNGEYVMKPYHSLVELMSKGDHLEHLHSYAMPDQTSSILDTNQDFTIDFHTDSGLMIAMTVGYITAKEGVESSKLTNNRGLYLQLYNGKKVLTELDEDSLVILIGEGGSRWLSPLLGAPFRAVPHAMIAGISTNSIISRSWYGKMYLPPMNAIIPETNGLTYELLKKRQTQTYASSLLHIGHTPTSTQFTTACGNVNFSRLTSSVPMTSLLSSPYSLTANDEDCDGITCWMRCMATTDLPCGNDAQCVDPASGKVVDGDITCTTCLPQCVSNAPSNSTRYCFGGGTAMFMQGFTSIATSQTGTTECVNLLFTSWTLNDRWKLALACIGVLFLGIAIQCITHYRFTISKWKRSYNRSILIVFFHGLQTTLSYMLMLVAMTYSSELFAMVCLGLSIGYALFNLELPVPKSTDPCCSEENDLSLKIEDKSESKVGLLQSKASYH
eukprot:gene11858-15868_t